MLVQVPRIKALKTSVQSTCDASQLFVHLSCIHVHVPIFGGLSGSEDRGGVTTVSNSLILGGWVTKVLKIDDEKWWGGGWRDG